VTFPYEVAGTYSVASSVAELFFVNNKKTQCGPITSCSILAKDCTEALPVDSLVSMTAATPWAVVGER
jgi:hypothetical protein